MTNTRASNSAVRYVPKERMGVRGINRCSAVNASSSPICTRTACTISSTLSRYLSNLFRYLISRQYTKQTTWTKMKEASRKAFKSQLKIYTKEMNQLALLATVKTVQSWPPPSKETTARISFNRKQRSSVGELLEERCHEMKISSSLERRRCALCSIIFLAPTNRSLMTTGASL